MAARGSIYDNPVYHPLIRAVAVPSTALSRGLCPAGLRSRRLSHEHLIDQRFELRVDLLKEVVIGEVVAHAYLFLPRARQPHEYVMNVQSETGQLAGPFDSKRDFVEAIEAQARNLREVVRELVS